MMDLILFGLVVWGVGTIPLRILWLYSLLARDVPRAFVRVRGGGDVGNDNEKCMSLRRDGISHAVARLSS